MKLAKREKLFIGVAAGIVGVLLIFTQLVSPFFEKKDKLTKETQKMEGIIKEMDTLGIYGQDIGKMSGSLENVLANRNEPLNFLIAREAEAIGLQQNIQKIDAHEGEPKGAYQEDIVDVKLKEITIPQLTEFLYRIEKPEKYIFIKRCFIKKTKKEGYQSGDIKIMSYKKVNPEQ